MDDYVEQNDISDDVTYDESSDTSIDDSDVFEVDETIEDVEVDESIESSDDAVEENVEFEEDSVNSEYDDSTDSIDDIPEDTITEDETLEEETEAFSEDVIAEDDDVSENKQEEILEDTVAENESYSENDEEEFLEDTSTETELIDDSSVDNGIVEAEDKYNDTFEENADDENKMNNESGIIEGEESDLNLEEAEGIDENNAEMDESSDNNADDSSTNTISEEEVTDFTETDEENSNDNEVTDSQNNEEQIEVIDDVRNDAVNSEIVESDTELERSEETDDDSDATNDEVAESQDADNVDDKEPDDSSDTDKAVTDENNDTDSDVETVSEQDIDIDETSLEESDIPNPSDVETVDLSKNANSVENDMDDIAVSDNANDVEPSLRERVIHPSFGQTVKIAQNMGDTLKADDAGFQTVKGYRLGKAGHLVNSVASKIANTPPGQTLIQKSVIDDAAHSFDSRYAILHPKEKFDFKTPSETSAEERASHTLEIEMPTSSYELAERTIPGIPGVVNVKTNSEGKTVGNSSELSKNLWNSFEEVPLESYNATSELPSRAKGYQAQHIIPVEMHNHPVLQKIGMNMNDATNGIFLPEPNGDVHTLTTHKGYHAVYNKVCEQYLDKIYEKHGEDAPIEAIEADVAKLQQSLKSVVEEGTPIYRRKANAAKLDVSDRGGGATEELLKKAIDKKFKI